MEHIPTAANEDAMIIPFPEVPLSIVEPIEPLMNIDVDEKNEDVLWQSHCTAQIKIQLPLDNIEWHPAILGLIEDNAQGRSCFASIDRRGLLDIIFSAENDDEQTKMKVDAYANDIVRVLGISSDALIDASIENHRETFDKFSAGDFGLPDDI